MNTLSNGQCIRWKQSVCVLRQGQTRNQTSNLQEIRDSRINYLQLYFLVALHSKFKIDDLCHHSFPGPHISIIANVPSFFFFSLALSLSLCVCLCVFFLDTVLLHRERAISQNVFRNIQYDFEVIQENRQATGRNLP